MHVYHQNIRIRLLTLLLLVALNSPLVASVDQGLTAATQDDYKTAFKVWKQRAEKGDVHTQATIAVLYHTGQGVKKDYEKAFYWYKKAAEQGNAAAQANLGVMYAKGTGTKQDIVKSYAWYSLAAKAAVGKKVGNHLWGYEQIGSTLDAKQIAQAKKLSQELEQEVNGKKK